jgi:hypothetical protein
MKLELAKNIADIQKSRGPEILILNRNVGVATSER